jgi:hypothetical protein
LNPTGFFRKVPKQPGRDRLRQKLAPYISHFDELETQLSAKLSESNFKPNEGTAQQCKTSADVSITRTLVLVGKNKWLSTVNKR